ncbi:MAG: hypothetical protein P1U41_00760 [Vicingaceae bacterium]|nr:hypothetical protein [Vicingaceae bacterium]
MSKTRLLSILVIALIALNIILIVVFVMKKPHQPPHHRNHEGPKNLIINKLHFDDSQISAYESLIKVHKTKVESKDIDLRKAKNELYSLLSKNDSNKIDSLVSNINNVQKDIEELHFNHFLDIKNICKENQLIYYEDLTHELARLFSPPHRLKK